MGFEIVLCKLAGVPFSDYEAWRDSIADEYFLMFCERVFEEDVVRCLTRSA